MQSTRSLRKSKGYFWGYFSIDQAQFGAWIIGFRRGQFGAEMLEGDIIARGAQAVNLHRERLGLWIRDEVGLRFEDLTRQASRIILVVSLDFLAQNVDQGCLRPVGHDFDRVDKVFAPVG